MSEFKLNTFGSVHVTNLEGGAIVEFRDLDAFTQSYVEALFFTDSEPGTDRETWNPETQSSLPGDVGYDDLAPEALTQILADCATFQALPAWQAALHGNDETGPADIGDTATHGGRDFWFTRNGHGCGFWDGDWPEPYATDLTDAAKTFGEVWSYLGDDGKVYLS